MAGSRTCFRTYLGPLAAGQEQISAALLLARPGAVPHKLNLQLAEQTRLEPHLLQFTTSTSAQTPPLSGATPIAPCSGVRASPAAGRSLGNSMSACACC